MLKGVFTAFIFCLILITPLLGIDQAIKLYICQVEHELDQITAWEYLAPDKYREAIKNGKLTPLEAAQESAGMFVNTERIRCDAENRLVVEKIKSEGKTEMPHFAVLDGLELENYCARTIKNYGHPCK